MIRDSAWEIGGCPNQFLHTMIRVFYLEQVDRLLPASSRDELIRRKDYPSGEFTLASSDTATRMTSLVIELHPQLGP